MMAGGGHRPIREACASWSGNGVTLHFALERCLPNATKLAASCRNHPEIETYFIQGLPSHPGYELAQAQMDGGIWFAFKSLVWSKWCRGRLNGRLAKASYSSTGQPLSVCRKPGRASPHNRATYRGYQGVATTGRSVSSMDDLRNDLIQSV